jgi:hypothetical protein
MAVRYIELASAPSNTCVSVRNTAYQLPFLCFLIQMDTALELHYGLKYFFTKKEIKLIKVNLCALECPIHFDLSLFQITSWSVDSFISKIHTHAHKSL